MTRPGPRARLLSFPCIDFALLLPSNQAGFVALSLTRCLLKEPVVGRGLSVRSITRTAEVADQPGGKAAGNRLGVFSISFHSVPREFF